MQIMSVVSLDEVFSVHSVNEHAGAAAAGCALWLDQDILAENKPQVIQTKPVYTYPV